MNEFRLIPAARPIVVLAGLVLAVSLGLASVVGLRALASGSATPAAAMLVPDPATPRVQAGTSPSATGCDATFTWGSVSGTEIRYVVTDRNPLYTGDDTWQDDEVASTDAGVTVAGDSGERIWLTATRVRLSDGARSGSVSTSATC